MSVFDSALRRRLVPVILAVLANAAIVFAENCTGERPENPAPRCGGEYVNCEGNNPAQCPDVASCSSLKGTYPAKVARACETGGAGDICKWGENDTECTTVIACEIFYDANLPGFVCGSNDLICHYSFITPKVKPPCTTVQPEPGPEL